MNILNKSMIFVIGILFSSPMVFSQVKKKTTTVRTPNGVKKRHVITGPNGNTKVVRTYKVVPNKKYHHLPKRRTVISDRPEESTVLIHKKRKYYYQNGIYLVKVANGYRIVKPWRGVRIKTLPKDHQKVVYNNQTYYYYYGTFYSQDEENKEYEVINPPVGAVVEALPDGYKTSEYNDETVYIVDNVKYKAVPLDENGEEWGYEVVQVLNLNDELEKDEILDEEIIIDENENE